MSRTDRRTKPRSSGSWARASNPGHQRGVDHVWDALAADRLDREVDVLQGEAVGRDPLERESLRGELLQRQLARLVAVAARALERHELHRDAADGEVGEFGELALHHHRRPLAL